MKNKKTSLMALLLCMSVIPVLILGTVVTLFAAVNLTEGIQEQVAAGLKSTSFSLIGAYENSYQGDYAQDASGNVVKGEEMITGNYAMMDQLKKNTEVDTTLFFGDTRVATSIVDSKGDRLVGTQASEIVVAEVLNKGQEYFATDVLVEGIPYYGFYSPIKNSAGNTVGMMFAGKPSTVISSQIKSEVIKISVIALIIMILASIVCVLVARSIIKALHSVTKSLGEVAQGNLSDEIDEKVTKRRDEIGSIGQSVEKLKDSLKTVIGNIMVSVNTLASSADLLDETAAQTSSTTDEVSRAIEDISSGAMSQAEETQTASTNILKMGELIQDIVSNVELLHSNVSKMDVCGKEAAHIIEGLNDSNIKTIEAVTRVAQQTDTTNDSAQQIKQAVEIITSIAVETNLLSLNASIEAARAGEAGRGFSVVAEQIQKLAEQSNSSAQKIKQFISTLLTDSQKTVEIMEEVKGIVAEQQEKLNETKNKFTEVSNGINSSMGGIQEIQTKTVILDHSRASIVDVIQNLSAISEENAASTEETTASIEELGATIIELANSAKELKDLSVSLEQEVSIFKL